MSLARAVFEIGGSERQRLPNILGIQLGIVSKQVVPVWVYRGALISYISTRTLKRDAQKEFGLVLRPLHQRERIHEGRRAPVGIANFRLDVDD